MLEGNACCGRGSRSIRLTLGPRMNLGDVAKKTVPKMSLISKARHGGLIDTRTFIPHRVHEAIGVLGAVSVATACVTPGSVAAHVARLAATAGPHRLDIEHPTGFFTVEMRRTGRTGLPRGAVGAVAHGTQADAGRCFVPGALWPKS